MPDPFSILKPIEKWITENGSAAVLEKHLALLKAELAVAGRKFAELASEKERLEAELQDCRVQAEHLRAEVEKLKGDGEILDAKELEILLFFFEAGESSIEEASRSTSTPIPEARHYAGSLRQRDFIRQSRGAVGGGLISARRGGGSGMIAPALYRITDAGSAHAMKNKG